MAAHAFHLSYCPGRPTVWLRELCGFDELMIDDRGTRAILQLLERIMIPSNSGKLPINAEKIVIADRDYLLSGIYINNYGPRIQSVIKCGKCAQPFDMDFSLHDLVSSVRNTHGEIEQDEQGFFHTEGEFQFRLPDGEDELAAFGMPTLMAEKHILDRCISGRHTRCKKYRHTDDDEVGDPTVFTEIEATCPECGERQLVIFDMQTFLLLRLKNERKRVAAEVHCLASAYRWSHEEILKIPRRLRKTYARMIGLE